MKLLLDTHVVLWWLQDDLRLGAGARSIIADTDTTVLVSIATPWEISIKRRIGIMTESGCDLLDWLEGQDQFEVLPLRSTHLRILEQLPFVHRDPFDHLIVAQAGAEGATIMTNDEKMHRYGIPCIGVA